LFTKFGTYHAADFLPLADLYRTQVIQLADHLGLQEFVASEKNQIPSSFRFLFDLPYEDIDRILVRLESQLSVEEIHKETGFPLKAINKVNYYYVSAEYARQVPLIPKTI
jgi:NH3-dependent NAD+ synthetase